MNTTLDGLEGYFTFITPAQLQTDSGTEVAYSFFVTSNMFTMLGRTAALGRTFTMGEESGVVVLSDGYWRRRFGGDPNAPLFREVRALILSKCARGTERLIRTNFERQAFGDVERLVTQTLLDVVKGVARKELENEVWLRTVAELGGRSIEEMRVTVLEFLDTDIFHLLREHCDSFLDPLIESWDIDLQTFALDIVLNPRVFSGPAKRFEFIEREADRRLADEPGFRQFLQDPALSGTATEEEIEFLERLWFEGKRPTPLYFYRELQNLRDPLHFRAP
jgi:hypothetical protein